MKQKSVKVLVVQLRVCIAILLLVLASFVLFSFTINKMADDFLKQLGLSKTGADEKIVQSLLGGSIDIYGMKNAKNIALGNRAAVTKDILVYTRQYANSAVFVKSYNDMRNSYKPKFNKVRTLEEMRQENIAAYQKGVKDMEEIVKKTHASLKPMFEKSLADGRKQLKEAEDPNNKVYVRYAKGYEESVKFNQRNYDRQIADWEAEYPSNHLLFVKKRLEQFLTETDGIDFAAELATKNGKKVFVNPAYESKGNRWKMAFRAGKDVITTARTFIQQWIGEIK